jgi:hypothetical protein
MQPRRFHPIIIVGAPRSGTNILRDVLTRIPGFGTWPCDEINYIWRHGNIAFPSDAFPSSLATPCIKDFIKRKFSDLATKSNVKYVVEKTCANSLRVEFVDSVLPDSKYLFIVRNGIDVVASAMKRWKAKIEPNYILRKARFIPPDDMLHYVIGYAKNRFYKILAREKRLASWGPRLDNMEHILATCSLLEICALQWLSCVKLAAESFSKMPVSKVMKIRYEDFVTHPRESFERICDFLGISFTEIGPKTDLGDVRKSTVGRGRTELGSENVKRLMPLIGNTLHEFGYG